ncbi:Uncharacterised protein [Fusobacterium necrophorum subsp. necrophorum]|nr:Uncharacterised protein [Fusobacterium necrophorum subsp. necrophorum]
MRINDFHNTLELVKQGILQSEAECLKLLKVSETQRYILGASGIPLHFAKYLVLQAPKCYENH